MESSERHAFWRGYKDYETYLEQRRLHLPQAFDSRYSPPWRPPEGHKEAYQAGWETAKDRHDQPVDKPRA